MYGQEVYWQQQVDYIIDVTLNDKNNTIDGFEKLVYQNNSSDTLHYIWFHIWPNAYKNDRTAFSEQMLENGSTKFYFSSKEQKGYINRLQFKVNGVAAKTEDHPQHADIIKLMLPAPLPPRQQIEITTPFHVKLPYNFSRGGYDKQTYQLTQWYPKPAVYDAQGWHPMPYLDQGEFYSEFGDFDVRITLPADYVVAATGASQNSEEIQWLKFRNGYLKNELEKSRKSTGPKRTTNSRKTNNNITPSKQTPVTTKTLRFIQKNVHDFALFANKDFIVQQDTCQLLSGKIINVFTYYTPEHKVFWKKSLGFAKDAVRFYSKEVGEYPYNVLSAVQGPQSFGGGMEYPTITIISPTNSEKDLDVILAHEIGHNWFYGILANNERAHPWLDEGVNSFYEKKYKRARYGESTKEDEILFQTFAKQKKDQAITTASGDFSDLNYSLIAYHKTAEWLKILEETAGEEKFRSTMQQYFQQWKFKHPQPQNFKNAMEPLMGDHKKEMITLLDRKGIFPDQKQKGFSVLTPLRPKSFKNYLLKPTKNALFFSPAAGYNNYDKLLLGALFTNYKFPPTPLQFIAVPLYGTGSKTVNGIGKISYSLYKEGTIRKMEFGMSGASFSKRRSLDSNGIKVFERFSKLTPSLRFYFAQSPRSRKESWVEAKTFFLGEKNFSSFAVKSTDSLTYVDSIKKENRYLNQLSFSFRDHRVLYPYDYELQLQQGKDFYRINFTGEYFFNYVKGGGAKLKLFAAKFGNWKNENSFSTFQYRPKLLGVTGEEDYTYSNYFVGRSASYANNASVDKNSGIAAQQIMIRDGGLKMRLDQFEFLQGRSQKWVVAINFNTSLPQKLFPIKIPLKLFFDIGTFGEAWNNDVTGSKFLYVGGLQLSLFKDILNIYAPVIYSSDFRNNLKTSPEQNKLSKKITFSIDLHRFSVQKLTGGRLAL